MYAPCALGTPLLQSLETPLADWYMYMCERSYVSFNVALLLSFSFSILYPGVFNFHVHVQCTCVDTSFLALHLCVDCFNVTGKKYTLVDGIALLCMSAGLIMFTLADSTVTPEFNKTG